MEDIHWCWNNLRFAIRNTSGTENDPGIPLKLRLRKLWYSVFLSRTEIEIVGTDEFQHCNSKQLEELPNMLHLPSSCYSFNGVFAVTLSTLSRLFIQKVYSVFSKVPYKVLRNEYKFLIKSTSSMSIIFYLVDPMNILIHWSFKKSS